MQRARHWQRETRSNSPELTGWAGYDVKEIGLQAGLNFTIDTDDERLIALHAKVGPLYVGVRISWYPPDPPCPDCGRPLSEHVPLNMQRKQAEWN